MTYTETVKISKKEFDRINRLLEIDNMEEMSDEELRAAGANTHHCEGVYSVRFEDGSSMNYDLCSGSENYYDDVVWTSPDGKRDIVLSCAFYMDCMDEEEIDGNVYRVCLDIQEN